MFSKIIVSNSPPPVDPICLSVSRVLITCPGWRTTSMIHAVLLLTSQSNYFLSLEDTEGCLHSQTRPLWDFSSSSRERKQIAPIYLNLGWGTLLGVTTSIRDLDRTSWTSFCLPASPSLHLPPWRLNWSLRLGSWALTIISEIILS